MIFSAKFYQRSFTENDSFEVAIKKSFDRLCVLALFDRNVPPLVVLLLFLENLPGRVYDFAKDIVDFSCGHIDQKSASYMN